MPSTGVSGVGLESKFLALGLGEPKGLAMDGSSSSAKLGRWSCESLLGLVGEAERERASARRAAMAALSAADMN